MSTLVLGVSGPPENTTALVRHNGQTLRVPVSSDLRPLVERSINATLPQTVAEQLLSAGDLGPRPMTYDNNPGSAYNPAAGTFPATAASVGDRATLPGAGESLLSATPPVVAAVSSRGQSEADWFSSRFLPRLERAGQGENAENIRRAIEDAAQALGVHPAAVAAVVDTESRFDPRAAAGSYRGATQMGPATFREAGGRLGGVTFEEYQELPLADQIRLYPQYLQHYGRTGLVQEIAAGQDPATQAAILQGFQFAPNDPMRPSAQSFVAGLREGDLSRPSTPHPQAQRLGDTSVGAMRSYFSELLGDGDTPSRAAPAPAGPFPPRFEDVQNDPQASPTQPRFDVPEFQVFGPPGAPGSAQTPEAPQTFGERFMAGLDDLPEALQYLELADNSNRMRAPAGPGIYRPRRGDVGSQALKRLGLGSLA
jgi:hypothetical protein